MSESEWSPSASDEEDDVLLRPTSVDSSSGEAYGGTDCCRLRCLQSKPAETKSLIESVARMSKTERVASLLTCLSQSSAYRSQGDGDDSSRKRDRFHYYAPFVGKVCKLAFQHVYQVSHRTLTLHRKRVKEGEISAKPHGNIANKHASSIDTVPLVEWFQRVIDMYGEGISVRDRRVVVDEEGVQVKGRAVEYTLLPSSLTWSLLYEGFKRYAVDELCGASS